jgi:hypothetical protein
MRTKPQIVDWSRCPSIACVLVDFWIGSRGDYAHIPPLCFFTDQALLDFCDAAIPEEESSFDSLRKVRQRLGLKHTARPMIKTVLIKSNSILFG